jgi:flagellar FliL protein
MTDETNLEKKEPETEVKKPASKFAIGNFNPKILIIGIPVFIVQLVLVYFITANFLIEKIPKDTKPESVQVDSSKTAKSTRPETEPKKAEIGKYIFQIEDIIVNPSDTEGKRLILTSIGFDVSEQHAIEEMKSKEVLLKDVIVSTMSSKTLVQLSNSMYKDSIKIEIFNKVNTLLPDSKLNSIYISKYIIQ